MGIPPFYLKSKSLLGLKIGKILKLKNENLPSIYETSRYGPDNDDIYDISRIPVSFLIAAPPSHFGFHNLKIKSVKPIDTDPIVIYPLLECAIIVSAWGEETNDPNVVNEKMN